MPLTPPYPFLNCSRLSRILILSSLLFSAIHTPAQQIPLKPVTLQLKWKHQFQFAGYYLALERGYYRKAGLAVTIVEGGPELDVVDEVLAGRADFGVGTGDLLVEYAKGAPVVVLGVIYQHAPLTMIVFTGPEVHSLRDLAGKPVMIEEGSSSLMAMLEMEGIEKDDLDLRPHTIDPTDLEESPIRGMSGYVTDEIFLLDNLGIEYLTYSPRSYGIDFYGDNFFTRRDLVDEDPSLAARFRDATIRGWKDARDDPHAAVDLILGKYSQRKGRAHLLFEANKTLELMTNLTMPGQMERERWEAMGATFVQSGFLSSVPDLDDFILDRPVFSLPPWLGQAVAGAVVLIGVLATIASYFYRLNRALQIEIFCRLASEQQLRESRDALQKTLSEVKQLRQIIPICAYCKKIRDDSGYWEQLETYIKHHAGADFSHGICPDCMEIELAKLP